VLDYDLDVVDSQLKLVSPMTHFLHLDDEGYFCFI
jgi:hypothetical protein